MWIIFALGASVTWGLTYVLNEKVYQHISVITSLAITLLVSAVAMFIVAISMGILRRDINTVLNSPGLLFLVGVQTLALIVAELFIGFSIVGKNATLAGLIEISYPIFIAVFAYILYKESQINFGTVIGGALIFTGIAIVYYFNK